MKNWNINLYAALLLIVQLIQIGIAQADAEKLHTFNLPGQPLATTLDQLAQASGTKLLYSDAAVQG
ncbi:MAG: hypothetical protein HOO93_05800, partial [Methyloglobulus sp.]|nr:hypothetical protein [Methyloglobulus sp.]